MNGIFTRSLLALLAVPALSLATSYNWPDVAPPCSASVTLQQCLNAVGSNDTVNVITSATLNEGAVLTINKPLTLRAAPGYHPVLAAGTSILASYTPAAGTSWSLTIEGFTLLDGAVGVRVGEGNANVLLRRFDITNLGQSSIGPSGGPNAGLGVSNQGTGTLVYEVAGNRVRTEIANVSQPPGVSAVSSSTGPLNGRIHDNRLSAGGVQAMNGIVVFPQGASTTRIYANQIGGNVGTGIFVFPGNANVTHLFDAVSNTVTCSGPGFPTGIFPVRPDGGSMALQFFNNTITGCYGGISVSNASSSGALSGRIANNLIAYNNYGLGLSGLEANLSNDHNLLFGNINNNYIPGPGTITSDPLLRRGKYDARLTAGSPAIDAADSTSLRNLLSADVIGEIDADGLRRFKGAASFADIGAFEYGDVSFGQRASNNSSFVLLDNGALSGNVNARPQVTTSREVESYQTSGSLYHVRFDYGAPNYYLYTEGGVLHYANSGFNVFAPAGGDGALLHTTTAGSVSAGTSIIDDAYLNGHPERIVLAHHRASGTVPSINDAISAGYLISKWVLQRNNGGSMPIGAEFHVYAQDPSLNAFFWSTPEVGDTSYTVLDTPIINDEPCAQIYAQQSGTLNPHPTQLRYVSALKRWRIENADNVLLPNATSFNVVVDEAATAACRYDHIFHDEFQTRD
jgi:hypothetical protein